MLKRITVLALSLLFVVSLIAACAGESVTTAAPETTAAAKDDGAKVESEETDAPDTSVEPKPNGEEIVLRLAEIHAQDYPTTLASFEFARLVEERTDGRIKIEVYYGGQLGGEASVVEQVQFGAIDFARISVSPVTEYVNELNVVQLPFIWRDADHMWSVLKGPIGDQLLEETISGNFVGLNWYDSGARGFYSTTAIETPDDLVGKKVRVMESKLMIDMIEALGASAVPIPAGEVYSALQTKIVDAAENCFPGYMTLSHNEVAKFFSMDEHLRIPEITVASKVTMDKLSAEDQEIIKQAAKDVIDFQIEKWVEKEEADMQEAVESGVTLVPISDEVREDFKNKMATLYDELSDEEKAIVEDIINTN